MGIEDSSIPIVKSILFYGTQTAGLIPCKMSPKIEHQELVASMMIKGTTQTSRITRMVIIITQTHRETFFFGTGTGISIGMGGSTVSTGFAFNSAVVGIFGEGTGGGVDTGTFCLAPPRFALTAMVASP
jgi:hypothetical protein